MRSAHTRQPSRRQTGYSLIELMVVLGVLAVLVMLTLPIAEMVQQRAKERELKSALWSIRDAIDAYHEARVSGAIPGEEGASTYPSSLLVLTRLHPDARPQKSGQSMRFLRAVPRDPFADASLAPEDTWVLRSYLSDTAGQAAGNDVYDVHTASPRRALNGTLLKDW